MTNSCGVSDLTQAILHNSQTESRLSWLIDITVIMWSGYHAVCCRIFVTSLWFLVCLLNITTIQLDINQSDFFVSVYSWYILICASETEDIAVVVPSDPYRNGRKFN